MGLNVTRFKSDLDNLISDGHKLEIALLIQINGEDAVASALGLTSDEVQEKFKDIPVFDRSYESRYSEGLYLIKQLLPEQLQDFREHYEPPKGRTSITYATYRIQDALNRLKVTRTGSKADVVNPSAAVTRFTQQLAIIISAKKRFESSLFEIRQLVQADLFDSELDAARELLRNKFFRAGGAIAGVVLEKHLRQVCDDHGVKITKKNPGISDLNELLKTADVINIPQWRHITLLGDYRNLCDHNKQQDPTADQVSDLINGVDRIIKTIS